MGFLNRAKNIVASRSTEVEQNPRKLRSKRDNLKRGGILVLALIREKFGAFF